MRKTATDLVTLEADGDREVAEKDGKQLKAATERIISLTAVSHLGAAARVTGQLCLALISQNVSMNLLTWIRLERCCDKVNVRCKQGMSIRWKASFRQLWSLLPADAACG